MSKKAPTRELNEINFATIHHSATYPGATTEAQGKMRAQSYDNYHSSKSYALETKGEYGYKWISYHYMVTRDGSVIPLQHAKYVRNHATDNYLGSKSHNRWGLAVLLDGNFDVEKPTDAQLESASQLIAKFNHTHRKNVEIKGHKEQAISSAPTNCPGKYMGISTQIRSKLRKIIKRVDQLSGGSSGGGSGNAKQGLIIAAILAIIYWFLKEEEEEEEPDDV